MTKKVKVILAVVLATAIGAGVFYACRKDLLTTQEGIKTHKSSQFFDQALLEQFMEEPLVQEFRMCVQSFGIEVVSGILSFSKVNDAVLVYDTLIYYSNRWNEIIVMDTVTYSEYVNSERFPTFPILYAFEAFLGFNSLRATLERQLLVLEAGDGIPDEENPNHHYIISDYEQTLLSPDCEIIVENNVFLCGEHQNIAILNLNFENLSSVKLLWRNFGETDGTVKAFQKSLAVPSSFLVVADVPCPSCDKISIKYDLALIQGCPRTYRFYASASNTMLMERWYGTDTCDIISIDWEFGDGTTGTGNMPEHTYSKKGTYTVKVTIRRRYKTDCVATKSITIKDCAVTIHHPVYDPSYEEEGARYMFTAKAIHCDGTDPIQYLWDFGDGTTETTDIPEVKHIYRKDGNMTISVTVVYNDGCSSKDSRNVKIENTGNCCRKDNEGLSENFCYSNNGLPTSHANSIYKLTHFFTTRQGPLWHRIVVKNTFYKRKNGKIGNKWVLEKSAKMYVNFSGQITTRQFFDINCNNQRTLYPHGNTNTKSKSQTYDYGVGYPFKVFREDLKSEFKLYIKNASTATDSQTDVLKLHNKRNGGCD